MWIYGYIYIHMYIYIYIYMYVYMLMWSYVYIHTQTQYININTNTMFIYVHIYIYISWYLHMSTCLDKYTRVYSIYRYMYPYICTYHTVVQVQYRTVLRYKLTKWDKHQYVGDVLRENLGTAHVRLEQWWRCPRCWHAIWCLQCWIPSGKLTWLWNITIFTGRTHYKCPFSIAIC